MSLLPSNTGEFNLADNSRQQLRRKLDNLSFQMRGRKMDQAAFLSQTLWQYFETSTYTDLSLICEDGELAVHTPMLASILVNLGVSCSADQERPECLMIPDLRYLPHMLLSVHVWLVSQFLLTGQQK